MKWLKYFLVVTFILGSCKKLVTEVNKDFIGDWFATTLVPFRHQIIIDNNNNGEYWNPGSNGSVEDDTHFKGKVRCNEHKLKIGRHKFDIVEMPHAIDTNNLVWPAHYSKPKPTWQMNLDGTVFYSRK